ncbi:hypothetical protein FRX31_005528, partial [Thalictrum thalictroides]
MGCLFCSIDLRSKFGHGCPGKRVEKTAHHHHHHVFASTYRRDDFPSQFVFGAGVSAYQ